MTTFSYSHTLGNSKDYMFQGNSNSNRQASNSISNSNIQSQCSGNSNSNRQSSNSVSNNNTQSQC